MNVVGVGRECLITRDPQKNVNLRYIMEENIKHAVLW